MCICTWTHVYVLVHMCVCMCVSINMHTYMYMQVYMCAYMCLQVCECLCIYVHIFMCTYVYMHVYIHIHVHACVYMYICAPLFYQVSSAWYSILSTASHLHVQMLVCPSHGGRWHGGAVGLGWACRGSSQAFLLVFTLQSDLSLVSSFFKASGQSWLSCMSWLSAQVFILTLIHYDVSLDACHSIWYILELNTC